MTTYSVTLSDADAARARDVCGFRLSLRDEAGEPRSATDAEVNQWMADAFTLAVLESEQAKAAADAKQSVTPISPVIEVM